eukprot:CAMPEP_0117689198 /NCGR_PEP_ID=MMETSP0804-20121206/24330_1 /TAXON_ID=1074897 /ORGANISM="Tetraselmis astigmatica, Strain CCMP880" /LENGTH=94 /DNA_ID=CAMNT_0005501891 /DNA_START=2632 /DNA_END=2916 /DNA_ORIENTATION=-
MLNLRYVDPDPIGSEELAVRERAAAGDGGGHASPTAPCPLGVGVQIGRGGLPSASQTNGDWDVGEIDMVLTSLSTGNGYPYPRSPRSDTQLSIV